MTRQLTRQAAVVRWKPSCAERESSEFSFGKYQTEKTLLGCVS